MATETTKFRLVHALCFVVVSAIAAAACADETRAITLNIQVSRLNGTPVGELPFYVRSSAGLAAAGECMIDGSRTVESIIPVSDSVIVVHLVTAIGVHEGFEANALGARLDVLAMTSCFASETIVPLTAESSIYSVPITVHDCVTISGVVSDAAGAHVESLPTTRYHAVLTEPFAGPFSVRAAVGKPTWLSVFAEAGSVYYWLSGSQLTNNLELGNIVLPMRQNDAQVTVSAENYSEFDSIMVQRGVPGISLVSTNGQIVETDGMRLNLTD